MLQVAEDAVRLEGMAGLDIQEILLCSGRTLKYKLACILCISTAVNVCGVLLLREDVQKGVNKKHLLFANMYANGGGETQTPVLFYFVFFPLGNGI